MPQKPNPVVSRQKAAPVHFCGTFPAGQHYIRTMELRYCLECGEGFYGRSDKRFCSDLCRNSWHNAASRQSKAYSYRINSLLLRNHSILAECRKEGKTRLGRAEMAERMFSERYCTACSRRFPLRTVYTCYDISYRIEGRRGIRILADGPEESEGR